MRARSIALLSFVVLLGCGTDPSHADAVPPETAAQGVAPAPAAAGPAAGPTAGPLVAATEASVAVERLDPDAACDGVVPETVPAAVDARAALPEGASCLGAAGDGAGTIALACADASGAATVFTFGPDGAARATATAAAGALRTLVAQPSGFHGIAGEAGGGARFLAIGADGAMARTEPVAPEELTLVDASLGADPAGGGVVVARGTHASGNHWFEFVAARRDGDGAAVSEPARITNGPDPTAPMFFAGAVSTAGATLAVWGERGTTRVAWLGRDGALAAGPADDGGTAAHGLDFGTPVELAPLLDGTVALRAGAQWRRAWAPSDPAGTAAPAWLADRPGTHVRHVRGSSAYALVPDPAATCAQRVELLEATGRLCGAVTVTTGATGSACPSAPLEVGRDGTLLVVPSPGAVRFWPQLLH